MTEATPKTSPTRPAGGRRIGTVHDDTLPIIVHERVLDRILDFSDEDVTRERGGFLLGGWYVDGREYVEVQDFVPAFQAESRAASLTFTAETWAQLHREVEQHQDEMAIVGWHHTHPNFGIFLSGYDTFIHKHFFPEPWQIAMVVDPQRQEFGFFQWKGDAIVNCGFLCVCDDSPSDDSGDT